MKIVSRPTTLAEWVSEYKLGDILSVEAKCGYLIAASKMDATFPLSQDLSVEDLYGQFWMILSNIPIEHLTGLNTSPTSMN